MTSNRTLAIALAVAMLTSCSDDPRQTQPRAAQATPPPPRFTCEFGKPAYGRVVDVSGFDRTLYSKPDATSPRVVNQKATSILRSTQYHTIDATTRVQIQCEHGRWAKIQLTEPEWLRHVTGWVEGEPLLSDAQSGDSRTFGQGDIFWDKWTTPHKAAILEAVNRIHRENATCTGTLDPSSVALSPSKSTPNKPMFFVTCGNGASIQNVFFTLE